MLIAMLIAITNPEWCLVIAIALFIAAFVICVLPPTRSYGLALIAAGLILFAAAFIIDP